MIALRYRRGLSQEQLAVACQLKGWDVSRGVIARIEGGVRWMADFELLKLAAALGVSGTGVVSAECPAVFQEALIRV
ncbi:helix-turn-helix domain-containing protein [Luteolibacter sp. Populi]|uniref:helix-turn-helix domain-containing protein n=1 Tax=Luteolibacter sp. Populi TaxID=3230487 RepID=UPI00346518B7